MKQKASIPLPLTLIRLISFTKRIGKHILDYTHYRYIIGTVWVVRVCRAQARLNLNKPIDAAMDWYERNSTNIQCDSMRFNPTELCVDVCAVWMYCGKRLITLK